jgi:mRNA-degrading endonuclease toxin of MazEF toxin-antitoxin module
VRGIPTDVWLGPAHGLAADCVASFDNLQPMRRSFLADRVGGLCIEEAAEVCRTLGALADC